MRDLNDLTRPTTPSGAIQERMIAETEERRGVVGPAPVLPDDAGAPADLRAARDGGIIVFTLRAPRDPEPHHILSVPAKVDDHGVMSFHLGTLQEMEGGAWDSATHRDGMALLDLTIPYSDLVAEAGPNGEEGLDADSVLEMAQPVVQCILKPGYPFALGASILLPQAG